MARIPDHIVSIDMTFINTLVGNLVGSGTPGGSLLLDSTPNLVWAGSLSTQLLSSPPTGNIYEAQVDGGGSTGDITFASQLADMQSLCGMTDGDLRTIYDQVGSRNPTQATASAQPKAYDGATQDLLRVGTVPVASFTAASAQELVYSTDGLGIAGNPGLDIFVRGRVNAGAQQRYAVALGNSAPGAAIALNIDDSSGVASVRFFNGNQLWAFSSVDWSTGLHVFHLRCAQGAQYQAHEVWVDGTKGTMGSGASPTSNPALVDDAFGVGGAPLFGALQFDGEIDTVIVCATSAAGENALTLAQADEIVQGLS